ncbi:MAG: TetR/AcrR family transcriptional regulator [Smithellaceae bacterium]|nr:TetR/AcrR family transcriptional regulator [Smithellaceae bacterium]
MDQRKQKRSFIKKQKEFREPGKTAGKILAAARKVFAENGYNGTHVDEIAMRAGVNKATLYYQIGDKDTLYANVIHQVLGNVAEDIAESVAQADHPEDKLQIYINCIASAVNKNPEIPPIMMREMASGGAHLPRVVAEDMASVVTILLDILEDGTRKGIFVETAPFLIHMMIMGTILFYKKGAPIKEKQLWLPARLKSRDKKLKGSLGDEVGRLVLKAIKK